ncbi:MAG TPA: carboxypeptidase-like regulatory domain-containing protein [Gemmatimonadaceae bacterium]|nr:carboxypeptidase-like regulatory domain-containing protein [Gemmatimonadaceae bacterium]
MRHSQLFLRRAAAPLAIAGLALAAACSRDSDSAGTAEAATGRPSRRIPRDPYRVVSVEQGGRIDGVVALAETPPPDTSVVPSGDVATSPSGMTGCGGPIRFPTVVSDGRHLGEAVVWLEDVRAGKPLPVSRRFELTNEGCLLVPRVQAVIAGGMLNVKNADPIPHRTRFTLEGDSIATVEHSDAGSVVPLERVIAHPGLVEARSAFHPWMRSWIQVFDQPYFAVTARDGRFTLDSIPAGQHHLVIWHPRYGTKDTTVTVGAGERASVVVGF